MTVYVERENVHVRQYSCNSVYKVPVGSFISDNDSDHDDGASNIRTNRVNTFRKKGDRVSKREGGGSKQLAHSSGTWRTGMRSSL